MSDSPATELKGRGRFWLAVLLSLIGLAVLLSLGTWQMQRLKWKEGLLATIDQRMHSQPISLQQAERLFEESGDVDYVPVSVNGVFVHEGERHFLATWKGQSGFYVYTPLKLEDGRFLLVNRGFVPYGMKEASSRAEGQVQGTLAVTGLGRNPLAEKPSSIVPDNDLAKNVFYWKDRDAMAASAGLPAGYTLIPFFLDADATPNPGGWPAGGVTIVDLPNNHLEYAVTWYGLAVALAGVLLFSLVGRRKRRRS
ncbi:SURF1 family protein [Aquamicrobium ahrensii]|uniref:SURF1-like protein n=1 Tax=Aquamicrobium ahrensii TaxID=469551 RepID=A0ABV2KKW7_9HYPH